MGICLICDQWMRQVRRELRMRRAASGPSDSIQVIGQGPAYVEVVDFETK